MGLFDFLKKKPVDAQAKANAQASADAQANAQVKANAEARANANALTGPDLDIDKITRVALAGGPSVEEALYLFGGLRNTPEESRLVEEVARTSQVRRLPEPILLVLASVLVDRGESIVAERVLAGVTSSPALMLAADLAERRTDYANALALVERVMLRDLDHPGARERHKRWRAELGFDVEQKRAAPGATVVTREPDAPFDLLREVGRGGAGAVYEAVDRELGRHVALKVYHQPERDRSQLAHEAKVAAALEGPGIVRVYDLDPAHGWLAFEWAMHGTLREKIRARDLGQLLPIQKWAVPLAIALARVHASGWVHHDVKPANVLVDRLGGAVLTDFGIARKISEPPPAGSLGYLSPERIAGRPSDPRDDIYGFGRVLEDVLDVVRDESTLARFRPLAVACTGPDAQRPGNGQALLTRMRVELGI